MVLVYSTIQIKGQAILFYVDTSRGICGKKNLYFCNFTTLNGVYSTKRFQIKSQATLFKVVDTSHGIY